MSKLPVLKPQEVVARLEAFFAMAPDTPAVYTEWRRLVTTVGISGITVLHP